MWRAPGFVVAGGCGAFAALQDVAFGAVGVCCACRVGGVGFLPIAAERFRFWDLVCLIVDPSVPFGGDRAGLRGVFVDDPAAVTFVSFAWGGAVVGVPERVGAYFFLFLKQGEEGDVGGGEDA